ncbi:MAG: NADH-quinone oxidoreductase subunit L, partial [Deefgea sp.]
MDMKSIYLLIPLAPLLGSLIAGLFGWAIGRRAAHVATISGVAVSFALSAYTLNYLLNGGESFNGNIYTW